MTVAAEVRRAQYQAVATTGPFPIPFQFFEVEVYLGTDLIGKSDYVVTQTAPGLIGSFSFVSPKTGFVTVASLTSMVQQTDYVENEDFPAASHELALDRLCMGLQDLSARLDRAIVATASGEGVELDFVDNPNTVLVVNEEGGVELITFEQLIAGFDDAVADIQAAIAALQDVENTANAAAATATANAALTAADRVQTGLDRVATTGHVSAAAASAVAAAADAVTAAASAAKLKATSTTSLAIAIASKAFTTQSGKQMDAGVWVLATSNANPANFMSGQVTTYVGTTLTVNVTRIGGSGTFADWTITVSGSPGAQGIQGEQGEQGEQGIQGVTGSPGAPGSGSGDVVGPSGVADSEIAVFDGTTGKVLKSGGTTIGAMTASILATVRNGVSAAFDTLAELSAGLALKLDASAYTATDVRTKLLTVDGAGSGVDADLLDGLEAVAFEPADANIIKSNVTKTVTVGYTATANNLGNITTGIVTLVPGTGNLAFYTNNGPHTLAPPAAACTMVVQITNGATAGAITTTGFTKRTGDAFTTTNGHNFLCFVVRLNGFTHLHVVALQ